MVSYIITVIDREGKRFKTVTSNFYHAMGINLWWGTVWQEVNGKRKMLKRVFN